MAKWFEGNTGAYAPPNYDTILFVASNGNEPYKDFSEWARGLQVTKQDVDRVGEFLVYWRKSETLAGLDVHGDPFQEYSPSYERRKKESLVNLYGQESTPRHMVDALQYRSIVEGRDGTRAAVSIGVEGNIDLITRARVHDQGAVVKSPAARRMMSNGRFRKRKDGTRLHHATSTFMIIPQREWMTPNQAEIEEAAEVFLESLWGRLGNTPGRNSPIGSTQPEVRLPNAGKMGFRPKYWSSSEGRL